MIKLPDNIEAQDIIVLGYPMQNSRPVEMAGSIKYYLDDNGTVNVPKRSLEDILYKIKN